MKDVKDKTITILENYDRNVFLHCNCLLTRLQFIKEQNKLALISCIEIVLMSMGNTKYNVVIAKLNAYNMAMRDSYKDLEVLKTVLKEVYVYEYNQVISDIKLHLGDLIEEKDIAEFFRIMES